MVFQVQFFEIGNLIFSCDQHSRFLVNSDDILKIQNRFQEILKLFQTHKFDYSLGFHSSFGNQLPFNSATIIGQVNEQLVLHFTCSYDEPIMVIYDTKKNTIRNYIDIKQASNILIDDTFEDIKEDLITPKYLNNRFKGISDFNQFIEMYQDLLKQYENKEMITGRECFEIKIDDLGDFTRE